MRRMSVQPGVTLLLVLVSLVGMCACDGSSTGSDTRSASSIAPVTHEAFDDHARLAVTIDRETLLTTEAIHVEVEFVRPVDAEVDAFEIEAFVPDTWSVARRSQKSLPVADGDISRSTTYEYEIEPFLPTTIETLAVTMRYRTDPDAEWASLTVAPFAIAVDSVLAADEADPAPADIKEIVDAPVALASHARTWAILGGVALILALAGWWGWRRYRRGHPTGGQVRQLVHVPAAELAIARLNLVQSQHLVERAEFKAFYNEVSLVLRRYIEERFGLHAPERTTEEFLRDARGRDVLRVDDVLVLERFLGHCDMVKFAEFQPTVQQARDTADTVRDFVERTTDDTVLVGVDADDPLVDAVAAGRKERAA